MKKPKPAEQVMALEPAEQVMALEVESIDWGSVPVGTKIYTSDHLGNLVTYRDEKFKPRLFVGISAVGILSIEDSKPVGFKYAILAKPEGEPL